MAAARRSPRASDLTDGHFTLSISPPGEIAPALEALDAVADGSAECAHTALAYYWNKDPRFVFASSTPFGMNARQHAAWLQEGGGGDLIDELLAERKSFALPAGGTGGQMAGWFRKMFTARAISPASRCASAASPAKCSRSLAPSR